MTPPPPSQNKTKNVWNCNAHVELHIIEIPQSPQFGYVLFQVKLYLYYFKLTSINLKIT